MQNSDKNNMSFLGHLEIFRWHLIRSFIALIICTIFAFICKNLIFDGILLASTNKDFFTYQILCNLSHFLGINDAFCIEEIPFTLINITMSGQFLTHIVVSFITGLIISFPYIFWELWIFIRPALHTNEVKIARGIVFFTSLLFFIGVMFGYFIIAPLSVNFLGSYAVSDLIINNISLTSFASTVATISLANGLIFQLPILVYFLTKIGLLTPIFMRSYRRHSMVIILILSAIITPPDVVSQILVSLPLFLLYEISIKISSAIVIKKKK